MKRIAVILFVFIFVFSFSVGKTYAESLSTKVEVDHIANVFEKLKERITLVFKFSPDDKFAYHQYLAEKRLGELKYALDTKQGNLFEETTSRYSTYLGNFTEFAVANKMSGKKDEMLKMYEEHQKILESFNTFEYETAFWMLMMHDVNAAKIYSTKVKDEL